MAIRIIFEKPKDMAIRGVAAVASTDPNPFEAQHQGTILGKTFPTCLKPRGNMCPMAKAKGAIEAEMNKKQIVRLLLCVKTSQGSSKSR